MESSISASWLHWHQCQCQPYFFCVLRYNFCLSFHLEVTTKICDPNISNWQLGSDSVNNSTIQARWNRLFNFSPRSNNLKLWPKYIKLTARLMIKTQEAACGCLLSLCGFLHRATVALRCSSELEMERIEQIQVQIHLRTQIQISPCYV